MQLPTLGDLAQFVGACVLLFNCWQAWSNARRTKKITKTVDEIQTQTNGLNAALLKVTGDSEFAKGLKQGEDNPPLKP